LNVTRATRELLFGVTKVGMTVVIADDNSQPLEVTHPGLVLGEYAARGLNAVDAAIKTALFSEGHEAKPQATSAVVSSADNSPSSMTAQWSRGKVEIQNSEQPLGERVFLLNGKDSETGLLAWSAANVGSLTNSTGDDPASTLRRIQADPECAKPSARVSSSG
jgi:hypothetical protein